MIALSPGYKYGPSRSLNILQTLKVASNELLKDQIVVSQNQLMRYVREMITDIHSIYTEMLFYVYAVRYARKMEGTGLPICFADIMPIEDKYLTVQEMYHPALVEYKKDNTEIVVNDIDFLKNGEILILTGMNQGGKTTFLRSVGAIQFLFQLGLPLPAKKASISPVNAIVSAFSKEENTMLRHGKLGQELNEIRDAIEIATKNGLVLFNEPITGTSPLESHILSREILSVLKVNGNHGIWVTHLYELAEGIEDMNDNLEGSILSSIIVSSSDSSEFPSYKISRGKPVGKSYAKEIFDKQNIFG